MAVQINTEQSYVCRGSGDRGISGVIGCCADDVRVVACELDMQKLRSFVVGAWSAELGAKRMEENKGSFTET